MKSINRVLVAAALSAAVSAPMVQTATASTNLPASGAAASTIATVDRGDAIDQVVPELTPAEQRQWAGMVSTSEGRARVLTTLQESFGSAITIGVPGAAADGEMRTNLATGITGDHFWIIVSYADVVNGAVAAGVAACATRLPRPLCAAAGDLINKWAAGWGNATNHGIWAEVYWWPPNVKVGRW
ncbi:hypothetical protein AB0G02_01595 [Actinosynnema sp. NPDC023658]|uniref:hypothetical protein n=1 Tax=Actinosynnema sp. NPDC023658 TaxID=3155465 RepID=UPI0033DB4043